MRTRKQDKDFTDLVDQLTDLSDKDFREVIRVARQFRRAQRMLERAIVRQHKERLPEKSKADNSKAILGVDYELA